MDKMIHSVILALKAYDHKTKYTSFFFSYTLNTLPFIKSILYSSVHSVNILMILRMTCFSTLSPSKEKSQGLHSRLLVQPDHGLVQGVLVLVQPAGDVIVHSASIVDQREVCLGLAFGRLGLLEVGRLPKVLLIQLVLEGGVCGLGEHALLFQDGEDAHGLRVGKKG